MQHNGEKRSPLSKRLHPSPNDVTIVPILQVRKSEAGGLKQTVSLVLNQELSDSSLHMSQFNGTPSL